MPDRGRSLRVEGVVLRHYDLGEADRLLSIYTREQGKVRAIAKGVRKMHSRKAGHLEPFTRVTLQLARGRDLFIITQAETVDAYLALRENLETVGYAAYVIELLDRLTYDNDDNRALYRLLTETLSRLNSASEVEPAVRYYEIRLLDQLGYRPQLYTCLNCEAEILPQDQYFSAALGGVLCPNCGPNIPDAEPISLNALKYLRHYQRSTYREAVRAQLTPKINQEMEQHMHRYLTYILERGLNTPAFIREVRRPYKPQGEHARDKSHSHEHPEDPRAPGGIPPANSLPDRQSR